jgi:DNA-binding response OmpR family regulator
MAKGRILIVEDDFDISNMLRIYFSGQGYDVMIAPRGGDAFNMARNQLPHLIILDIMLPDMDGYAVCRQLRQTIRTSHIPIIFLTQKDERSDRIAGLELGADDYITKPFNVRELIARVRAVLRRLQKSTTESEVLRAADIVLDRTTRTVTVGDRAIDLTPSEFAILATLMAAPGQVFSRLDLLDRVSGEAYEGYERTIDVHIRNLRTKIEPDPRNPQYVDTVYGMGYRFTAQKKPSMGDAG